MLQSAAAVDATRVTGAGASERATAGYARGVDGDTVATYWVAGRTVGAGVHGDVLRQRMRRSLRKRYSATWPNSIFTMGAGDPREWTATSLKPYPYQHDDGRESFTDAGRVVVRGASHDDPEDALSVTRRWSYDRRRAASGQHVVGFRCATSDDLGEVAPGGRR